MGDTLITRKDFLKKVTLGGFAVLFASKFGIPEVKAATSAVVSDNINSGGVHIGNSAPANIKLAWIDTGNYGVMKYHNGTSWIPIRSTWDND